MMPRIRTFLSLWTERLRRSTWSPILLRAVVVALALVGLAQVGRTAAAGTPSADADAAAPQAITQAAVALIAAPTGSGGAAATPAPPPPPATTAGPMTGTPSRGRASADDPVYLNHASVDDLRRLPGVGQKRAEAIVALRQKVGRFQRVEDLMRVKGIGRATVRKWRPVVRLDAPATASAGAPSTPAVIELDAPRDPARAPGR